MALADPAAQHGPDVLRGPMSSLPSAALRT